MSTDRELLELAAKAAGYTLRWYEWTELYGPTYGLEIEPGNPLGFDPWNPLNDDGDALRLAVKLALDVEFQVCDDCDSVSAWRPGIEDEFVDSNGDRQAAARRAIVISAAQIGREMP